MTHLLTEVQDHVLMITLNRPEKRNAFNNLLWQEFTDAIVQYENDDSLWVAIITASGNCFCAGSDLKELAEKNHLPPKGREDWGFAGITKHYCPKPLIAAVNGVVTGGGLELMMACDLVVATKESKFSFSNSRVGGISGHGLLRLLNHLPHKVAMEIVMTGEYMQADRAGHFGLVNKVVENEEALLPAAMEYAELIMLNAPNALRYSKEIMERCIGLPIFYPSEAWDINDECLKKNKESSVEDASEGKQAFFEKRKPVWKGK